MKEDNLKYIISIVEPILMYVFEIDIERTNTLLQKLLDNYNNHNIVVIANTNDVNALGRISLNIIRMHTTNSNVLILNVGEERIDDGITTMSSSEYAKASITKI